MLLCLWFRLEISIRCFGISLRYSYFVFVRIPNVWGFVCVLYSLLCCMESGDFERVFFYFSAESVVLRIEMFEF